MTYPFDDCWRFGFICGTTNSFNTLGSSEQDDTFSSLG